MTQYMCQQREMPTDLGWTIFFLIPKDNTYTWGIGLLDTLWNVVEEIIDTRLRASISPYDDLHGFRVGRLMKTAILELKLAQDLASVNKDPLFMVLWTAGKPTSLWTRDVS